MKKVVITGGNGRLGRMMARYLRSKGFKVFSPRRCHTDWSDPKQAFHAARHAHRVLALAAYTDVSKAQVEPEECVRGNVLTTTATLDAAARLNIPVRWVGTDYTVALERGGHGVGWYAASKSVAEKLVTLSGNKVARVAFTTEEQVSNWGWVDGLSLSNRCWADELVPVLADWFLDDDVPPITTIGPKPVTPAELLSKRYPSHRALDYIISSPEILERMSGGTRPPDTTTEGVLRWQSTKQI